MRLLKVCSQIALLIGVCFLAGCSNLVRLAAHLKETGNKIRLVSGTLEIPLNADREVIVVVLGDDQGKEIHNYRVFERDGAFRIAALRDSRFLFAFQDLNRDFSYQANEPATWFDLAEVGIQSASVSDVRLVLSGPTERPAPLRMTCWNDSYSPWMSERKCSVPFGSCNWAVRLMIAVDAACIDGYFSDSRFRYFSEEVCMVYSSRRKR